MTRKDIKKVNKNLTKLIRIDAGYHKLLSLRAKREEMTIKRLLEGFLSEVLTVEDPSDVK